MNRFQKTSLVAVLIAGAMAAITACDGGTRATRPKLELDPSTTEPQMTTVYTFKVLNTGDGPLTLLSAPVMNASTCPDGTSTAFTMELPAAAQFPMKIAPTGKATESDIAELPITVKFTDPIGQCGKTAKITIASDDQDRPNLEVNITSANVEPNVEVKPNPLNMGMVLVGPTAGEDYFLVQNTGLAPLQIDKIEVIPFSEGFSFVWGCERKAGGDESKPWTTDKAARIPVEYDSENGVKTTIDDSVCSGPVVIPPNESIEMPVFYTAATGSPARAVFRFFTNDPTFNAAQGGAYEAELRANYGGPCISTTPESVDFGSVVVGTGVKGENVQINNCGDETLLITKIFIADGSSPDFSLDLTTTGTFNEDHPLEIVPGGSANLVAKFTPSAVDKDDQGKLIPDEGILVIENNSPRSAQEVPLKGLGVEAECAKCQFVMNERIGNSDGPLINDAQTINPQINIGLHDKSTDPTIGGGIESRLWTVEQPKDSVQVFLPVATAQDVTFQPNVVGSYKFCLEVFNKDGCSDKCCQAVEVVPPQGCHIELTWNTPSDPDQTDTCYYEKDCGSDMDLHIVHPLASGKTKDPQTGEPFGYFDMKYDCYWMHLAPTWFPDNEDPLYQPSMDLDDTDGAGPENFTYTIPDPDYSTTFPACYRVGVHYYDDHQFGKSYPTVRVFINSTTPVYEKTLTQGMSMLDMWDVGRVCCSNQEQPFHERVNNDGTPLVIRGYKDESIGY